MKSEIQKIIEHYVKGDASAAEKEVLFDWVNSDPKNHAELKAAMRLHDMFLWNDDLSSKKAEKHSFRAIRIHFMPLLKYAAIVAFFLLGALFFYTPNRSEHYITVATRAAETLSVTLPDGSLVHLNAMSSLSYPEKFSSSERKVVLEGEAYFDIRKNPEKPFIVRASDVSVVVKGTTFLVSDYPLASDITVGLIQGRVSVSQAFNQSDSCHLLPDQQFCFNRQTHQTKVEPAEVALTAAWRENKYYFRNITLEEMTQRLERIFNVKIMIQSASLKQEKVYADFLNGENVNQMLDAVNFEHTFIYTQKDNTYVIREN